jgi:hypothetical protein
VHPERQALAEAWARHLLHYHLPLPASKFTHGTVKACRLHQVDRCQSILDVSNHCSSTATAMLHVIGSTTLMDSIKSFRSQIVLNAGYCRQLRCDVPYPAAGAISAHKPYGSCCIAQSWDRGGLFCNAAPQQSTLDLIITTSTPEQATEASMQSITRPSSIYRLLKDVLVP